MLLHLGIMLLTGDILLLSVSRCGGKERFEGRYTKNIGDFELLIPKRLNEHGAFVSYSIPNYFKKEFRRQRRSSQETSQRVHYGLSFGEQNRLIELWPNHDFLSPGLITETWGSGAASDKNKVKVRSVSDDQCHYVGNIKGEPESKVALSLCDGMVGHIRTTRSSYFIEPVKGHEPKDDGQHLHIIHTSSSRKIRSTCGITYDWHSSWLDRFEEEFEERKGADTDLKTDHRERLKKALANSSISNSDTKRSSESKINYMEVLLVADKKFLEHHNGTDYQQYLFTVLNMAAELFHDASVGNEFELSLVRVIYLEKEEEEFDLIINTDADATLSNFCKWAGLMNFNESHPNHHDIAILVTKYDICVEEDCATAGLAYVSGACSKKLSCAYCEDTGLDLGVIITHEIGHLLGSDHDSEAKNPGPGHCSSMADDYRIHVMAPWSQYSAANWSVCSRKFISEFLDNDLGKCFLDEPQEHDFKIPEMPPGVVYDATWQCTQLFGPTGPCNLGPEKFCQRLACKNATGKGCLTMGQPPVDGTSCGNNKWCYERQCVDIGGRPEAVNGGWSGWSSWSVCSRTCGGGATFQERICNNPTPANRGRYCLGHRRQYKLCNTQPCDEGALTFRELQCKEHDSSDLKWDAFDDGLPEHICSLVCSNNKNRFRVLAPRVKDGTSCKRGERDKCIGGQCRKVGCDWVLESDAEEDKCGVCNGDGSSCTSYDKVFNKTTKEDYQKLLTIPAGCRKIIVEEIVPSINYLALGAPDGNTFFLNGNFEIDEEGETNIAGSICVYTEEEPDQESIVISGPLKADLAVYMVYNGENNKGIRCQYSCPNNNTSSKHTYHWEVVQWGPCNARCGGGSQVAEPSCIDDSGGKVSNKFCEKVPKPEALSRVCNDQPCRAMWRTSEWSKCSSCNNTPGFRYRVVECIKDSPFMDSVIITEENDCEQDKPAEKEACRSKQPCSNNPLILGKGVGKHKELIAHGKLQGHNDNKECTKETKDSRNSSLVVDKVPPDKLKVYEMTLLEDSNKYNMSDAAVDSLGDRISDVVDETKEKVFTGKNAVKELEEIRRKNDRKQNRSREKERGTICNVNRQVRLVENEGNAIIGTNALNVLENTEDSGQKIESNSDNTGFNEENKVENDKNANIVQGILKSDAVPEILSDVSYAKNNESVDQDVQEMKNSGQTTMKSTVPSENFPSVSFSGQNEEPEEIQEMKEDNEQVNLQNNADSRNISYSEKKNKKLNGIQESKKGGGDVILKNNTHSKNILYSKKNEIPGKIQEIKKEDGREVTSKSKAHSENIPYSGRKNENSGKIQEIKKDGREVTSKSNANSDNNHYSKQKNEKSVGIQEMKKDNGQILLKSNADSKDLPYANYSRNKIVKSDEIQELGKNSEPLKWKSDIDSDIFPYVTYSEKENEKLDGIKNNSEHVLWKSDADSDVFPYVTYSEKNEELDQLDQMKEDNGEKILKNNADSENIPYYELRNEKSDNIQKMKKDHGEVILKSNADSKAIHSKNNNKSEKNRQMEKDHGQAILKSNADSEVKHSEKKNGKSGKIQEMKKDNGQVTLKSNYDSEVFPYVSYFEKETSDKLQEMDKDKHVMFKSNADSEIFPYVSYSDKNEDFHRMQENTEEIDNLVNAGDNYEEKGYLNADEFPRKRSEDNELCTYMKGNDEFGQQEMKESWEAPERIHDAKIMNKRSGKSTLNEKLRKNNNVEAKSSKKGCEDECKEVICGKQCKEECHEECIEDREKRNDIDYANRIKEDSEDDDSDDDCEEECNKECDENCKKECAKICQNVNEVSNLT